MNYIDVNGINYNQIVKVKFNSDDNITVFQNLPMFIPGPYKGTDNARHDTINMNGKTAQQFKETLEAYTSICLDRTLGQPADPTQVKILKSNMYKANPAAAKSSGIDLNK